MALWESSKKALDLIPKALVKFMDWATDGNKVADTQKALNKADQAKQNAITKREKAVNDYRARETDLNAANEDITKANALLEHDTNYFNNVITNPRIKNLYDNAANATDPAMRKAFLNQLAKELVDDNYVQFSGNPATKDIERLKKLYEYMYPKANVKNISDDDIYAYFLYNKQGSRDFNQFFSSLKKAANDSLISSQAKLNTAQTLAKNSSEYAQRTQDFNKAALAKRNARNNAITARREADVARRAYEAALATQANKLRGMKYLTYTSPLGLAAGYFLAPNVISNLGQVYKDFMDQPKSSDQEIFNEAGTKALSANSEPLPDPSIRGQSFRLPGMATVNSPTPSAAPVPAPTQAPTSAPAPVPQEQPVSVASVPSSDNTYDYLSETLDRPKVKTFTPTIQGRRTPSQEAALAKGMFDYRRQSARNALNGLSPAEAVQRGIIPYEALAYV